jgi:hypothetical protein
MRLKIKSERFGEDGGGIKVWEEDRTRKSNGK